MSERVLSILRSPERGAYLARKLPPSEETISAPVGAAVEIVRDRVGIPHVFAASERDAQLGLGYCMGRDRLWQLDYLRREAFGTLAEILGPSAHANDLRMRTVGIPDIAAAEADRVDGATRELVDAFLAGVNLALEAQRGRWPVEFDLLEYEPAPWTHRDTLAVARGLWWQLNGRLEQIVAAEAAARHLPDDNLFRALMTPELPDERIVHPMGSGDATGSNNWVVAGDRSSTGRALLASDPHLPFVHPSDFYEAHLAWPDNDVVGACFVGMPGIFFGHNRRVAWGVTNNAASQRDLYLVDGPFEEREVEIRIRGEEPRRHTILSHELGPLINDVTPPVEDGGDPPLALRWVGAEHLDDLRSLLALNRATDWPSFRAALSDWALPTWNWVYADASGEINYQNAGRVPLRGRVVRGYRRAGEPDDEWRGYVPYDEMPRVERPARGFHVTANNRVAPDDFPHPLYGAWAGGNRALRVRQRLEALERLSPEMSRDVQNDVFLLRAARLEGRFAELLRRAGQVDLAALLESWDCRYTLESRAATLFETLMHVWAECVIAAGFPARLGGLLHGSGVALGARLLEGAPISWFDGASVEDEALAAVRRGVDDFRSRGSPAWGDVHAIAFRHPLSQTIGAAFAEVADIGPAPVVGTGDTVRNAAGSLPDGFRVASGAEYRLLVDFAARPWALATNTLGQSGQPGSAHFADQFEPWVRGDYHPLWIDRADVEREATARTRISPA